jgi:hypothetical protein
VEGSIPAEPDTAEAPSGRPRGTRTRRPKAAAEQHSAAAPTVEIDENAA